MSKLFVMPHSKNKLHNNRNVKLFDIRCINDKRQNNQNVKLFDIRCIKLTEMIFDLKCEFVEDFFQVPVLIINTVSTVTRIVTVRQPAVTSKDDVLLSVYQEKGIMIQY